VFESEGMTSGIRDKRGREEKCTNLFVGKPESKCLLGRPKRRWEDNIKNVRENIIETRGLDSSGSGWEPTAYSCE
jgi:hypothetical protein